MGSSISLRGRKATTKAWEDHAWGQVVWPYPSAQALNLWESSEGEHEALEGPAWGREYNRGIGLSSIFLLPAAPQMLLCLEFPYLDCDDISGEVQSDILLMSKGSAAPNWRYKPFDVKVK